jgi:hypothetical protein
MQQAKGTAQVATLSGNLQGAHHLGEMPKGTPMQQPPSGYPQRATQPRGYTERASPKGHTPMYIPPKGTSIKAQNVGIFIDIIMLHVKTHTNYTCLKWRPYLTIIMIPNGGLMCPL